MHQVTLDGLDTVVEAAEGRRLVLAIEDGGIDILHRCGGNARCATCRVEIVAGEPSPITEAEELRLAKIKSRTETTRLSCQVQVRNDLKVRVRNRLSEQPELGDSGPRPIEWPVDRPLPPEEGD
jgi:ferredoxin